MMCLVYVGFGSNLQAGGGGRVGGVCLATLQQCTEAGPAQSDIYVVMVTESASWPKQDLHKNVITTICCGYEIIPACEED